MARGKEKLCLVTFLQDTGVKNAISRLYEQQKEILKKIGSEKKIGDVLVVFRDLQGAIYNPRARGYNYWAHTMSCAGPGRVSVIYHPMFMQYTALLKYVQQSRVGDFTPIILADACTIESREQRMGYGVVERKFPGLRSALQHLAEEEDMTLVEYRAEELLGAAA